VTEFLNSTNPDIQFKNANVIPLLTPSLEALALIHKGLPLDLVKAYCGEELVNDALADDPDLHAHLKLQEENLDAA
jgi:hypothetical protein